MHDGQTGSHVLTAIPTTLSRSPLRGHHLLISPKPVSGLLPVCRPTGSYLAVVRTTGLSLHRSEFITERDSLLAIGIELVAPRLLSFRATDSGQEGRANRGSAPQPRTVFLVVISAGHVHRGPWRELYAQATGRIVVPGNCFDNRARQSP